MTASNATNSQDIPWHHRDYLSALVASILSGLVSGYQSFIALLEMLKPGVNILFLFRKASTAMAVLGIGIVSSCNALINFHMGFDLFRNFFRRLFENRNTRPTVEMSTRDKFKYWCGLTLIVINIVLFGCAGFVLALTMGCSPAFTVLAVTTGLIGALLNGIQEIETWLEKFENKKDKQKSYTLQKSVPANCIGGFLAFLIAASVSAFLTTGLIGAFAACGFGTLPLLGAAAIACTIGGSTIFMYYNQYLPKFFGRIRSQCEKFKNSSLTHKISVVINAIATGASSYTGLLLLSALIAVPCPLVILAGAVGLIGSLALGIYFLPDPEKNTSEKSQTQAGKATLERTSIASTDKKLAVMLRQAAPQRHSYDRHDLRTIHEKPANDSYAIPSIASTYGRLVLISPPSGFAPAGKAFQAVTEPTSHTGLVRRHSRLHFTSVVG